MKKKHTSHNLSDDDFTPEELSIIYGIPHPQTISCEDDTTERSIEYCMESHINY